MVYWAMELKDRVSDVRVSPDMKVTQLIEAFDNMHGFMAGHLASAVKLLREGLKASDVRILAFTGNLVATGLRGVLSQLIEAGLFNVIFTTAGAVDHDIARSAGGTYYKGWFEADDVELEKANIHRLGNIFIPLESYGLVIERFVERLVEEAVKEREEWGVYELLAKAGSLIEDKYSILRAASTRNAYVFVPGWPDGAFGTALFTMTQAGKKLRVDYMIDMAKLSEIFFRQGTTLALIIGGGISKHHAIWWSQFRGGLDYVVYVTTAVEYDGSLSGAHPREAITWGKVKPKAKKVVVYGDATIIVPIIAAGLLA